jgi:hypothetical protein
MDQRKAIQLCKKLESISPPFGLHVALTGGCLYKYGERKDVDIILYRIRQVHEPDYLGFYMKCSEMNICTVVAEHGWVTKATTPEGINIDFFNTEYDDESSEYGLTS